MYNFYKGTDTSGKGEEKAGTVFNALILIVNISDVLVTLSGRMPTILTV